MIRNNNIVRLIVEEENRKSRYALRPKKPHETSKRQPAAMDWWPSLVLCRIPSQTHAVSLLLGLIQCLWEDKQLGLG